MNETDKTRIREWTSQACLIALICISVTAPAISLSSAIPYFKAEQLLVPVIFAIYLFLLLTGVARPIRINTMFAIGLGFFICNIISMVYGGEVLGHPVILRDFYDLPKVWLPVAFFTIAYEAELTESSLRRLLAFFSFAVLLVCIYAWGQFVRAGFSYKLNPYYSPGGHIDATLEYARRVYSTMGNANVLGELMTWCITVFLLALLFRVGSTLRNFVLVMSCLITLVMTGSRYGIVNVTAAFLMILAFVSTTGRRRFAQFALLLLLVPVIVWTYQTVATSNLRTLERYQTLQEPLRIDSLRERVDDLWLEAWTDFQASPVFGHGPSKAIFLWHERFIDSEYLNVLREKGIVGFLAFLPYYLYPLILIRRGQKAIRSPGSGLQEEFPAHVVCLHTGFVIGALAMIMNVGMSTFYSPFLQGVLWLWLGVGAGCAARLCALVPAPLPVYARANLFEPQKAPST